ncbi:MAG: hypothetical protein AB2401_08810, partial [Bacillus sp. (in: firmicutes)]|nr:hypothetical protein J28TS4_05030 [Paenibacillus lautus]
MGSDWYGLEKWSEVKKSVDEASKCSECEYLDDGQSTFRCKMYGGAKLMNADEKHCEDSIR